MRNFFNKIADFLYNILDYLLITGIILVIVLVIGWKLNMIFGTKQDVYTQNNNLIYSDTLGETDEDKANSDLNSDNDEENNETIESTNESTEDKSETTDANAQNENNETELSVDDNNTTTVPSVAAENNVEKPVVNETVSIVIPEGTIISSIGDILVKSGLITSSEDFVNKTIALKLDTKLRSGSYQIAKGTSLEEIIKIIAHNN